MKQFVATLFLCVFAALAGERVPTFTQARADAVARRWQSTLRLNDWHVNVRVVALDELPDGAAAYSRVDEELRVLSMAVLQPSDYGALATRYGGVALHGNAILRDIEDSILHELVYLRVRDFREARAADMELAEEYTVVRLTEALIAARSGK